MHAGICCRQQGPNQDYQSTRPKSFPWNKFEISSLSSKNVVFSSQKNTCKIALKTEEQTAWLTSRT
jgi:hypothetical protein